MPLLEVIERRAADARASLQLDDVPAAIHSLKANAGRQVGGSKSGEGFVGHLPIPMTDCCIMFRIVLF